LCLTVRQHSTTTVAAQTVVGLASAIGRYCRRLRELRFHPFCLEDDESVQWPRMLEPAITPQLDTLGVDVPWHARGSDALKALLERATGLRHMHVRSADAEKRCASIGRHPPPDPGPRCCLVGVDLDSLPSTLRSVVVELTGVQSDLDERVEWVRGLMRLVGRSKRLRSLCVRSINGYDDYTDVGSALAQMASAIEEARTHRGLRFVQLDGPFSIALSHAAHWSAMFRQRFRSGVHRTVYTPWTPPQQPAMATACDGWTTFPEITDPTALDANRDRLRNQATEFCARHADVATIEHCLDLEGVREEDANAVADTLPEGWTAFVDPGAEWAKVRISFPSISRALLVIQKGKA
jgi:hypothetical protein